MSSKLSISIILLFLLFCFVFVGSVWASSVMWNQTYGGGAIDSAWDIVQISDGGYVIAGATGSFGAQLS